MSFPLDEEGMRTAGYRFLDRGECDACHKLIEWWRTPKGRQMPMNSMPTPESPAVSHWATCPAADQFQKKG